MLRVVWFALAEFVGDSSPGDLQQPGLESPLRAVVLESFDFLGEGNDRFLKNFLGFNLRQARLDGYAIDQPPVQFEKIPPTLLVVPVLEPQQQTFARRNDLGTHNGRECWSSGIMELWA